MCEVVMVAPHMSTDGFHVVCDCAEARASKTDYAHVISKNAGDEMAIAHDADWGNDTVGHDLVHHNHHNNHLCYVASHSFRACAFPISEEGFGGVEDDPTT